MTSAIDVTKNAKDVIHDLATADDGQARTLLDEEMAKPEAERRKTVIEAAKARLAELAPVVEVQGEVLESIPDGGWAQLLDGDGEPVLVDGNPVDAGLVP